MATVHSGGQPIPGTFTNHFVAHLQAAVAARFATGKGFFLTMTGQGEDGAEVTTSHWLHPGIPLAFSYDVSGEDGAKVAPVALNHKEIEALTAAMDQPNGVRGSDGVWWPFAEHV